MPDKTLREEMREVLENIFKSDDPEFDMEHIEPRIVKAVLALLSAVEKRVAHLEEGLKKIIKHEEKCDDTCGYATYIAKEYLK